MLHGFGMLRADGGDIGRVEHKITFTERRGSRSAEGVMWGGTAALEAFGATETTLVREDNGYEMTIVIIKTTGDGMANIAVSGSPGPL